MNVAVKVAFPKWANALNTCKSLALAPGHPSSAWVRWMTRSARIENLKHSEPPRLFADLPSLGFMLCTLTKDVGQLKFAVNTPYWKEVSGKCSTGWPRPCLTVLIRSDTTLGRSYGPSN